MRGGSWTFNFYLEEKKWYLGYLNEKTQFVV